jgi:DNA primase
VISLANNLYHCFGCGVAGSVIDWTMKTQGLSFRYAVELLKPGDIVQMAAGHASAKPVKRNTRAKHPKSLATDPDQQATLKRVIDYYHECL